MSRQFDESVSGLLHVDTVMQNMDQTYFESSDGAEWARIQEFPWYFVSNYGDVMSFSRDISFGKILKPWSNQYGHLYVQLRDGRGCNKKVLIHRLVATYFIPNPHNYPVVRHLNDDPTDNYVGNLAWGTQADNMQDCKEHERMPTKAVYCYELNKIYRSCADAAEEFGVTRGLVTMCCQGKVHKILGEYHLCYLDEKDEKVKHPELYFTEYDNCKRVKAINIHDGTIVEFPSRKVAGRELGIADSGISNVIAGRITHVGDWTFENY